MMKVSGNFCIKCDSCGYESSIEADSLDYDTSVSARNMGEEIEYDFYGEICCEGCSSVIDFNIKGWEYPLGVFNFSDSNCNNGKFIGEPTAEMNYQFDEDYYEKAYEEYKQAEALIEHNKDFIKNMSSREFEFFVANIFEKLGFNTKITQETRDGGRDIIATKATPIPYSLIVECKHWKEENKVNVSVIRSLFGVQTSSKVNKSIVVTSSRFTKDARKFAEEQETLMTLWDIDDLLRECVKESL